MRDFGPIVEPLVLPMLYSRQDLHLRRAVTLKLVGRQHPWCISQSLEQLAQEAFSSLPVTPLERAGYKSTNPERLRRWFCVVLNPPYAHKRRR